MKKGIIVLSALLTLALYLNSCIVIPNPYSGFAPGPWRATLKLEDNDKPLNTQSIHLDADPFTKIEDVTKGELPFNFEVVYETKEKFYINIINGEEKIRVDDIKIGRNKRTAHDTFRINLPTYNTYIKGEFESGVMEGKWVVPSKENYEIPFVARHGHNHRFTTMKTTPLMDITGKWATIFGLDTEPKEAAIGEFAQKENQLSGTFLTETGDYRYLDGTVQGDKMYLSCFDGAHAFLFEGKIAADKTIVGSFRSGHKYKTIWTARLDANATLRNANEITKSSANNQLSLNIANPEGKMISLQNADYQGKVKLIQVMGTWCPNCKDESNYIVDFLKNSNIPNVTAIGLAFERYKDKAEANAKLATYKKNMNIPYELVLAGAADKKEASMLLPMLNEVTAFPTLLIVDKKNKIRRIHTGFSGPATSEYQKFKADMNDFIKQLAAE